MTETEIVDILTTLAAAVTPFAVAFLGWRQWRATQRVEARSAERDAALLLIEQYQEEVRDVRARFGGDVETLTVRLAEIQARVSYIEGGIRILSTQIRALGHEPAFVPNGGHYGDEWTP